MSGDFLATVNQEGEKLEDLFGDKESDTPTDSQPETNDEKEEEVDTPQDETEESVESQNEETSEEETSQEEESKKEESVPFHEHPRWKQREEDWNKRLEAQREEFEQKLQKQVEDIKQSSQSEKPQTIDPNFARLFGEDQEAYAAYTAMREKEKQEALDFAREQLQAEQKQKQDQENQWNTWVNSEIDKLKADGKEFDKNKLLKVALDYKPTDDKGRISLEKAYMILDNMPKPADKAVAKKKKVASKTSSRASGDTNIKSIPSSKDLRNKDWLSY